MPAVYTSFASFSFGSKHGKDKILLCGSLAGRWAGGCWTRQDHAWAAIVLLPLLRPGSSQIPGELAVSGLPNSTYASAPKAFKILTQQLLFKVLEGAYLPCQRHLPQHPQTWDNARVLLLPPAENPLFPRRISVKHRSLLSACGFCADPRQTWTAHTNFRHKRLCFLGNSPPPKKSLMHACKKTQAPAHTHTRARARTHTHTQMEAAFVADSSPGWQWSVGQSRRSHPGCQSSSSPNSGITKWPEDKYPLSRWHCLNSFLPFRKKRRKGAVWQKHCKRMKCNR